MENIIDSIVSSNRELFGDSPKVERVNVGFTNIIFIVNDRYVVKICTNSSNEEKFAREIEQDFRNKLIDFYQKNKDNGLIPRLYYASVDKSIVPYYYEVMEKIEGISLYNVWHTLNEVQRENIIR